MIEDSNDLFANSKTVFSQQEVVESYHDALNEGLQEPEKVLFERLMPAIRGKKLLDMGIGAGRTTAYLSQLTNQYQGFDYAPALVKKAQSNFPDVNIYLADARDLSRFDDETFDFILFAFNGIDFATHHQRILMLKEIHRILKPGGYFMFSSHNRSYYKRRFRFFYPKKKLLLWPKNLKGLLNYLKNGQREVYTDQYAIVNDKAHNYSLMTYYITLESQVEQLKQLGFNNSIECVNRQGHFVDSNDAASNSVWIYYCALK